MSKKEELIKGAEEFIEILEGKRREFGVYKK